jgi:integrase
LAPRTIKRYRDVMLRQEKMVRVQPALPLLPFWEELGTGEPVWAITLPQFLAWYNTGVRNHGAVKVASDSELNIRKCAVQNFLAWVTLKKRLEVDEDLLEWTPSYESRASVRRKDMKLNPLGDGTFAAIWLATEEPDTLLWIGMSAFMTMRIAEIANLQPHQVDLESRTATFVAKGGRMRVVHYGSLAEFDWPLLPHLRDFPEKWLKLFEVHVERCQDDQARDPDLRWVCPFTEGESLPARDNPSEVVWTATMRDLNRFDKSWQRTLRKAGFEEREHNPHQLRHFAATNLWRAGTDFERLKSEMGHDEAATTHGYVDLRAEFDRERRRNEKLRAS